MGNKSKQLRQITNSIGARDYSDQLNLLQFNTGSPFNSMSSINGLSGDNRQHQIGQCSRSQAPSGYCPSLSTRFPGCVNQNQPFSSPGLASTSQSTNDFAFPPPFHTPQQTYPFSTPYSASESTMNPSGFHQDFVSPTPPPPPSFASPYSNNQKHPAFCSPSDSALFNGDFHHSVGFSNSDVHNQRLSMVHHAPMMQKQSDLITNNPVTSNLAFNGLPPQTLDNSRSVLSPAQPVAAADDNNTRFYRDLIQSLISQTLGAGQLPSASSKTPAIDEQSLALFHQAYQLLTKMTTTDPDFGNANDMNLTQQHQQPVPTAPHPTLGGDGSRMGIPPSSVNFSNLPPPAIPTNNTTNFIHSRTDALFNSSLPFVYLPNEPITQQSAPTPVIGSPYSDPSSIVPLSNPPHRLQSSYSRGAFGPPDSPVGYYPPVHIDGTPQYPSESLHQNPPSFNANNHLFRAPERDQLQSMVQRYNFNDQSVAVQHQSLDSIPPPYLANTALPPPPPSPQQRMTLPPPPPGFLSPPPPIPLPSSTDRLLHSGTFTANLPLNTDLASMPAPLAPASTPHSSISVNHNDLPLPFRSNQAPSSLATNGMQRKIHNSTPVPSLLRLKGYYIEVAQNQYGSRFIQHELDTASLSDKVVVFREIAPRAVDLMLNAFGNFVIQKFFEVGSIEQKQILIRQIEGLVVSLSLQMYGCRVIQKAIEYVSVDLQLAIVTEFDGYVIKCIKDQNGNHVIQKCIEFIPPRHLQFVVDSLKDNILSISTHSYGCRVIQRVLEHCSTDQTAPILIELLQHTDTLIKDQYGNYVIQHVLEHGFASDRRKIIERIKGRIVELSMHKFASNVVEKAISISTPIERNDLIKEIIPDISASSLNDLGVVTDKDPHSTVSESTGVNSQENPLLRMIKDQFANYVVQTILDVVEQSTRQALIRHISPHLDTLLNLPYCKRLIGKITRGNVKTNSDHHQSLSRIDSSEFLDPRSKHSFDMSVPGQFSKAILSSYDSSTTHWPLSQPHAKPSLLNRSARSFHHVSNLWQNSSEFTRGTRSATEISPNCSFYAQCETPRGSEATNNASLHSNFPFIPDAFETEVDRERQHAFSRDDEPKQFYNPCVDFIERCSDSHCNSDRILFDLNNSSDHCLKGEVIGPSEIFTTEIENQLAVSLSHLNLQPSKLIRDD